MKRVLSLDKGWKFKKEREIAKNGLDDYFNMFASDSKTGMASDARGSSFFDGDWENVNLPDDWNTRECCSREFEDKTQGHKPRGAVWYRKTFSLNPSMENRRVFLKFEAIAIKSDIWVNSIKVSHSESGYTSIYAEITDFIRTDRQNCIAVRCDNTVKEGWWYEGGGVYGSASLIVADHAMLVEDGTFVRSEQTPCGDWTLYMEIAADVPANQGKLRIMSAELGIDSMIPADRQNTFACKVSGVSPWDIENPWLYPITIQLICNGEVLDETTVRHGFRSIRFDADNGFFLNEQPIKLKGVCIHHDFAGVGIAIPYQIQRYRIERLKEMGCNAIRTSHNPQLEGFYRACDELGILVMDEVRHFSSTEEGLKQLRALICRDRNHPSVILWSIFNEEPLQCTTVGKKMAQTMKRVINSLDGTRPITGGMNGPMEIEGVVNEVDVIGFNYGQYEYDEFHEIYPRMPIIGSETASYLTSRDTIVNQLPYLSSFGNVLYQNLHKWSATIGDTWKNIDKRGFVAGGFDWTGFDYRGECGEYPATVCNFGAMDLCGFPKGAYYWHKVLWDPTPQVYLSPFWEYSPGETVQIACYSNCEAIEVFNNEKWIFSGQHDRYQMRIINTAYVSGTLRAVGYMDGKPVAEYTLRSPENDERKLILSPVRTEISNRHDDWNVVNVYLTDMCGTVIPNGCDEIFFKVRGGKIIGVGNGDICCCEKEKRDRIKLFHGCAQLIVCGDEDIEITAACGNLLSRCTIAVKKTDDSLYIHNEKSRVEIAVWRQSDVQKRYIERQFIADMMFAWIPTTVGYGKNLLYSGKYGYSEICGQLIVTPDMKKHPFAVVFEKIIGNVDIYLNHDLAGSYINGEQIVIPIDTEKYSKDVIISVVFKLDGGDCGIVKNAYATQLDQY